MYEDTFSMFSIGFAYQFTLNFLKCIPGEIVENKLSNIA